MIVIITPWCGIFKVYATCAIDPARIAGGVSFQSLTRSLLSVAYLEPPFGPLPAASRSLRLAVRIYHARAWRSLTITK